MNCLVTVITVWVFIEQVTPAHLDRAKYHLNLQKKVKIGQDFDFVWIKLSPGVQG